MHPLKNHYMKSMKELYITIPSCCSFSNMNLIFGLSPNVDWERIWDENES